LVHQRGIRFICVVTSVDVSNGSVKVSFPTWPDMSQEWLSHYQIYSITSLPVNESQVAMLRLDEFLNTWQGFRFKVGDRIIVKCGKIARFDATIKCRTLRRMDGEDTSRESISSGFSPAYLVDSIDTEYDAVIGAQDDEFIKEANISSYPITTEPTEMLMVPKLPTPSATKVEAARAALDEADADPFPRVYRAPSTGFASKHRPGRAPGSSALPVSAGNSEAAWERNVRLNGGKGRLYVPYPRLSSQKRLWWATCGDDLLRQPYNVHERDPAVYPFRDGASLLAAAGPGCDDAAHGGTNDRTPKRRATAAGPAHMQGLTDGLDDSAGSPAGQDTASTEDDHDGSQAPKAGSASEDDLDRDGMATDADAAEEQDAGSGRETASTDAAAETSCEVVVGAELAPASFMTDTLAGLPVCTECDVVIWSNSPTMECTTCAALLQCALKMVKK